MLIERINRNYDETHYVFCCLPAFLRNKYRNYYEVHYDLCCLAGPRVNTGISF
jgi:hypothetical protein